MLNLFDVSDMRRAMRDWYFHGWSVAVTGSGLYLAPISIHGITEVQWIHCIALDSQKWGIIRLVAEILHIIWWGILFWATESRQIVFSWLLDTVWKVTGPVFGGRCCICQVAGNSVCDPIWQAGSRSGTLLITNCYTLPLINLLHFLYPVYSVGALRTAAVHPYVLLSVLSP